MVLQPVESPEVAMKVLDSIRRASGLIYYDVSGTRWKCGACNGTWDTVKYDHHYHPCQGPQCVKCGSFNVTEEG